MSPAAIFSQPIPHDVRGLRCSVKTGKLHLVDLAGSEKVRGPETSLKVF